MTPAYRYQPEADPPTAGTHRDVPTDADAFAAFFLKTLGDPVP